jgi:lipopolysaccharide assembly outer membrane protein LptD (OstA)
MRWIALCLSAFLYAVSMQSQSTLELSDDTGSDTTTLYSADRFERSEEYLDLYGNVEVSVGQMRIKADHVRFRRNFKELSAYGNVILIVSDQTVNARNLEWKKDAPDKATITFE